MPRQAEKAVLQEWLTHIPMLIDRAFKARKRGVSHRGMLVGAAAFAHNPDGSIAILDGANHKPQPGTVGPRKCAEEEILKKAEDLELKVLGMVIVAPHQVDDATKLDLGVTPCCVYCRNLFRGKIRRLGKRSSIMRRTHLLFVNADLPEVKVRMSVQEMFGIFNGHAAKARRGPS